MKTVAIWFSLCGVAALVGAGFAAIGVLTVARWLADGEDLPQGPITSPERTSHV